MLLFDRISVAIIADDNTDGRDKQTITQMAGINNIKSKRYLKYDTIKREIQSFIKLLSIVLSLG